jgi:hypothetical protein
VMVAIGPSILSSAGSSGREAVVGTGVGIAGLGVGGARGI